MIKVLHLFTTLNNGGVESFLYNYYSNMDLSEIRFDEIVSGNEIGYLEPIFKKLKSNVYHVEKFRNNPIKHCISVAKIIKTGNYDIIHCHGYKSIIGLIFAKIYRCEVRIIHSHMAYVKENCIQKIIRKLITIIEKRIATHKFACGIDAAKWLFGEKDYNKGKVTIINNAIDLSRYSYSDEKRKKIRNELNVNSELIVGNIARLTDQKNQEYLLRIMMELIKEYPNSKLLLVGEGEDEIKLKQITEDLKISNNVLFLGLRKDVEEILSAIDIFVLPSKYEGLPVVLAEVQASGLYSIVSDTITKEVNVTNMITYLSLDEEPIKWSKKIIELFNKTKSNNRNENCSCMENGKYDIKYQAQKLFNYYKESLENERKKFNKN